MNKTLATAVFIIIEAVIEELRSASGTGSTETRAGPLKLRKEQNTKKGPREMNNDGFREDELITGRMNGQTTVFPLVGGRLRLAHEENGKLSLGV